jgi:hypothetical protein
MIATIFKLKRFADDKLIAFPELLLITLPMIPSRQGRGK